MSAHLLNPLEAKFAVFPGYRGQLVLVYRNYIDSAGLGNPHANDSRDNYYDGGYELADNKLAIHR